MYSDEVVYILTLVYGHMVGMQQALVGHHANIGSHTLKYPLYLPGQGAAHI